MKRLTASLAALTLAACSAETDPAQQYRDALPKAQAVTLGTPQTEAAATGALSVARQPLGDSNIPQSEYAVMSYYLAVSVNGGAGLILNLVQFITSLPPTSCGDASCTWGPWAGDMGLNLYKLDVRKDGGAYLYALSGKDAAALDAPFVDLLTGTAYPVDKDHGSGTFTLDFDAQDALAHGPSYQKSDFGKLVLGYDNTHGPTISADFLGAYDHDPANPHFMNARYEFVDAPAGGQLQVAFENLDTLETVALRTRWSASGQGRSDVVYTPAGGPSFTASECWAGKSADFVEVYDTKHLDIPQLSDPSGCAPFTDFMAADISLPPQ